MRSRAAALGIAAAVLVLAACPAAVAATLDTQADEFDIGPGTTLYFVASPGEHNRVSVRFDASGAATVTDTAPLRISRQCFYPDASNRYTATCRFFKPKHVNGIVDLGDGGDAFLGVTYEPGWPGSRYFMVLDGPGNDYVAPTYTALNGSGNDYFRSVHLMYVVTVGYQGLGNDVIYGTAGGDTIEGGPGNDRIYGWGGNDRLFGGTGFDRLLGGTGNDVLVGGLGIDLMSGQLGVDRVDGIARDFARR